MLQAPVLDGLAFDLLPFQQDDVATSEVDVGGREIAPAPASSAPLRMSAFSQEETFGRPSSRNQFRV